MASIRNTKFSLKDITLGMASGEREFNLMESDINRKKGWQAAELDFSYLFYETEAISKVLEPFTYFLVGRKGSGKTLLSRYIQKNKSCAEHNITCTTYKNFELQSLQEFKNDAIPNNQYFHIWKWCILGELARQIVKYERLRSVSYENSPLRALLKNIGIEELDENVLVQKVTQVKVNVGAKPFLGGERTETTTEKRGSYVDYIQALESSIIRAARDLDVRFTLFCDDLDDNFGNPLFANSCKSLIDATVDLNNDFYEAGVKVKAVLLLRSDVFSSLDFPNLSKYMRDYTYKLSWESLQEYEEFSPLISLVMYKVAKSIGADFNNDIATDFDYLFRSKIREESSADFLINVTMCRPRDAIELLNIARKAYMSSKYFSAQVFDGKVMKNYANSLLDDIKAEMSGHIKPEIRDEYFKLIKKFGKYKQRSTFFTMQEILNDQSKNKILSVIGEEEGLERILSFLYRFGVIGSQERDNDGRVVSQQWSYREDNSILDMDSEFVVHPGLRRAF